MDNPSAPLLQVHDLTMTFDGLLALNSVSLEVKDAEIVGIIGPNGSGKDHAAELYQ